jgi:hypothetical protein
MSNKTLFDHYRSLQGLEMYAPHQIIKTNYIYTTIEEPRIKKNLWYYLGIVFRAVLLTLLALFYISIGVILLMLYIEAIEIIIERIK